MSQILHGTYLRCHLTCRPNWASYRAAALLRCCAAHTGASGLDPIGFPAQVRGKPTEKGGGGKKTGGSGRLFPVEEQDVGGSGSMAPGAFWSLIHMAGTWDVGGDGKEGSREVIADTLIKLSVCRSCVILFMCIILIESPNYATRLILHSHFTEKKTGAEGPSMLPTVMQTAKGRTGIRT